METTQCDFKINVNQVDELLLAAYNTAFIDHGIEWIWDRLGFQFFRTLGPDIDPVRWYSEHVSIKPLNESLIASINRRKSIKYEELDLGASSAEDAVGKEHLGPSTRVGPDFRAMKLSF